MNIAKYRKFLLTFGGSSLLRPDHGAIKAILTGIDGINYWCMCDEVDDNEIMHTHLFILFDKPVPGSYIINTFPVAHVETNLHSVTDCIDFVRKQGIYYGMAHTFEDSTTAYRELEISKRERIMKNKICSFAILFSFVLIISFLLFCFLAILHQYLSEVFIKALLVTIVVFFMSNIYILGAKIWRSEKVQKLLSRIRKKR